MRTRTAASILALGLCGCGSNLDFGGSSAPPNDDSPIFSDPAPPSFDPGLGGFGNTDDRPVKKAAKPPVPITGGTLIVTRDGLTAVAADPDRDRLSIVRLSDATLLHTVALDAGDEPGRLVETSSGHVVVALRRGGAIATIDLNAGQVLERRDVCGSPRGVAYDARTDRVHVACSSGELVTFPASNGSAERRLRLDVDLRDVVVKDDGLYVSRFKSAELLRVGADGAVAARFQPTGVTRMSAETFKDDGSIVDPHDPMEPSGAWRTLASPKGDLVMLHQYALAKPIVLPPEDGPTPPPDTSHFSSAYGVGAGTCGGLVQATVSRVDSSGAVHMGSPLIAQVLAVDAAVSPDGKWIALAHAGGADNFAGTFGQVDDVDVSEKLVGQISVLDASMTDTSMTAAANCARADGVTVNGQPTAVAFNPGTDDAARASNTWLVVQSRQPARLYLFHDAMGAIPRSVDLGGDSEYDTGHELFHRDAGAGIACASCHLEGGEDGRVWQFDPIGNRRTQAVHVGLKGTEPFHWDGDMHDFGKLMDEVLVKRMGGFVQSAPRKEALQGWLFGLRPPASIVAPTDAAAERGRTLFESSGTGCTTCHAGEKLTSNVSVEVGTTEKGHKLQVPSLHGVGFRAPFLHDGCAATLQDRFIPSCGGGDAHGHTSQLNGAQIDDLVAYLESL